MKCLKQYVLLVFSVFSLLFIGACGGGSTATNGSTSVVPKTNPTGIINPMNSTVSATQAPLPVVGLNFCSYIACVPSSSITSAYLKTGPNTHSTKVIYLYNNAASRANILKIQSTNQSDLAITNTCTSYLDPGKYCTISLNYNPTQYSANPTQPSTTSVVVNYSILDAGIKSLSLNVSYVCASPNLITVASPNDLTTTVQELDMDLNPNLYPYFANGSYTNVVTAIKSPSSTGWNPGNTAPHPLNGTVYIVNTGNDAALVSWPTTTSIPNLNVQVNEGCQSSGNIGYELQPGSYCSLKYVYAPITIPSDIITNAGNYIQTSNINYSDSESINSYNTPLKVAAYSTTNAVFSTMPDCLYQTNGQFINLCESDGATQKADQQINKQGYNSSILLADTGLSPLYLTIPWLYYLNNVQLGILANYFYVYNAGQYNNHTTNFVFYPEINGLSLPTSAVLDYANMDMSCGDMYSTTCWQPISYSSLISPNCSGESCMTNLQYINSSSTSNKILMSLPIKYIPQNSITTAFFGYMNNDTMYVLTGEAVSSAGNKANFGIVNNTAIDFCVENPGLSNTFSYNSASQPMNITYPTINTLGQTTTMNYYMSACITPAPTQTNSISYEYTY